MHQWLYKKYHLEPELILSDIIELKEMTEKPEQINVVPTEAYEQAVSEVKPNAG